MLAPFPPKTAWEIGFRLSALIVSVRNDSGAAIFSGWGDRLMSRHEIHDTQLGHSRLSGECQEHAAIQEALTGEAP